MICQDFANSQLAGLAVFHSRTTILADTGGGTLGRLDYSIPEHALASWPAVHRVGLNSDEKNCGRVHIRSAHTVHTASAAARKH